MNKDFGKIKIIIGLGNPGKSYENTYHNVGHIFVDTIDRNQESGIRNQEFMKSEGYMNHSGSFVAKATKKTGAKPENLLVVHDDGDLEIGTYKFSFGSGSAGHRGVDDIIRSLKTKDFWRLRVGIRPSRNTFFSKLRPRQKTKDFVLKKISSKNQEILSSVFKEAVKEISKT